MSGYRVGRTYGVHVYQGDRPVATFFDADEAAAFVAAVNGLGGGIVHRDAARPSDPRTEGAERVPGVNAMDEIHDGGAR